jgi:hypothetical protein
MNARLLRTFLVFVAGFLLTVSGFRAAAQAPFTNQPVPAFLQTPLAFGSAAWGDYDNDGKLDLLLIGTTNNVNPYAGPQVELWHNDGNGQFHKVLVPAPGIFLGTAVWVDYDNDGYLDFMVAGSTDGGSPNLLFHNQHDGTFTNVPLPGIANGFLSSRWSVPYLSWGDYDHDGRPDLAIVSTTSVQVWHNDGGGAFSLVPISLPNGVTVQWADMDNDGWVDLVIGGTPGNNLNPSQVFHNNFTNNAYPLFTLAATIPNLNDTPFTFTPAVADYNNDGLLDLVACSGDFGGGGGDSLWKNLGANQFTNVAVIPGETTHTIVAAGDYDNDGVPDIAELSNIFGGLLHNDGSGNFSSNAIAGLVPGNDPTVSFGDYDNDGRLDLFTADNASPPQLWHNITPLTNTPPTAPAGLNAVPFTNGVQLSWNPATDAQTPSAGLSYNLRVGTAPGTDNYLAAEANLATGWRRVAQLGAIQGTNYTLTQMPPGIYYWSVQAIDAAFAGGKFGTEGTFAIPGIAITPAYCANVTASSAVFYCSAYTGGTPTTGYFEWGLTTSYGNATAPQSLGAGIGTVPFHQLLSGLQPGTYYHFRVVASNAVTVVRGVDTSFYTDPAMLLGDVNGDGVINGSEAGNIISNYFYASQVVLTNPAALGGGNFQFGLAIPGWHFTVQASSDLVTWSNLTTSITPFYEFNDPQATNSPHRYYRLR